MPRETISTRSNEDASVKVGWSSDPDTATDVQLGVGIPGHLVIDGVNYEDFWVHLNRQEANRLIRTLRRARDATFGADA